MLARKEEGGRTCLLLPAVLSCDPLSFTLLVRLGQYKQQASTHAQLTIRRAQRTARGRVGETVVTIAKADDVMITVQLDHAYSTEVQTADAS